MGDVRRIARTNNKTINEVNACTLSFRTVTNRERRFLLLSVQRRRTTIAIERNTERTDGLACPRPRPMESLAIGRGISEG